jgi:Protein of unknown function (DUF3500)
VADAGQEDAAREVGARLAVAARMAAAAADWLAALDPEQRAVAAGRAPSADGAADAERRRWFYTPTDHGGLPLAAQRPAQQRLALRLVASGLLIEYDNVQRGANHAHSVWRDPVADFGSDVLGAHLAAHHGLSLGR